VNISLDSVSSFTPNEVTLVAGTNTNYTCSYTKSYISILNITGTKQFTIEGGILKVGINTSCYFIIVNNTGILKISHFSIEFTNKLNSIIYMEGGTVTLEYLYMTNQHPTYWVFPLVSVSALSSNVIVHFLSCTIINCSYMYNSTSATYYRSSPVVCFRNDSNSSYSISLNMSSSSFHYNSFFLNNYYNNGGTCCFYSNNIGSGLIFFLVFCFYCLFFCFYIFNMFFLY
jgi:hypothetical protein